MDFEQYNSLNILITELFSDSLVNNATVKLWDGISKVYEPVKIEGNKHSFEVDNKNQHYQVMITSPEFTERNAFVNMNKNLVDTVMTIVPKDFLWHFYEREYQEPGEAGFPMDLKFEKGIKPIIYLVNSKEFIKETTNPDVKGMLEYLASHFTEKKTIENFTYGKIDALKDNQIVWLDSFSQVPNFRDKNQYFIALVMNNKMGNNGGASSVPHGLTLGTGFCEFQTHNDTGALDEIFYEEVGTVLAGARGVYNGDRKTSVFEDSGPPNLTEYNYKASKVYVSRENLIQVKNENGYTDNDIPPYEGSLKDPKSVNIIFKTYQEEMNVINNAYTNFKNFINSKK
jgi:hypothetical protein